MGEKFLDKVYGVKTDAENRALYDAWSATYDDEVTEHGYITPVRCAAALAGHLADHKAPILDFGCGTGLSGAALAAVGFHVIDGCDLSDGMLATARERGVYRDLRQVEPDAPLDVAVGDYAAIAAIGVISTGAAPASTLDTLLGLLNPGGMIVFSFNDHALADPSFEARVKANLDAKAVRQLHRDYGDHLPGMGLKSAVYVLEKI